MSRSKHLETIYRLFCQLRPFPRERLDWVAWLDELRLHLYSAIEHEDSQGAHAVVELLYNDPRGSTPWGSSTPAPDMRAMMREQFARHERQLDALQNEAESATARALTTIARVAQRYERVHMRDIPESDVLELARRVVSDLGRLDVVTVTPDGHESYDRALANALELARRLESDLEREETSALDVVHELGRLSQRAREALLANFGGGEPLRGALERFYQLRGVQVPAGAIRYAGAPGRTVRRGTEPHAWEAQPDLPSGRKVWTCPRCDVSISPEPGQIAAALAINDCPGKLGP